MSNAKNKFRRYKNLVNRLDNWPHYLARKVIGFNDVFNFKISNFEEIAVHKKMLGPFRENFFDDIYFLKLPTSEVGQSPTIIDIGGNVGFFSLASFRKFPNAKIYALEPHPYCYNVLSEHKKLYNKFDWNIYNIAVSDKDGTIPIYTESITEFGTMSGIHNNNNENQVFDVKSKALKTFINDENLDKIDFIKLDCEGAEYSILYALNKEYFDKIQNICIETHKGKEDRNNIHSLNEFIVQQGYQTEILIEDDYVGYIWAWR